jgi:coproporphyrinogen III oxidase
MREKMIEMVRQTQSEICEAMTTLDGRVFLEDRWERPGGGGGWTRILQEGSVFEKAGVNVSVVHGTLPPAAAKSMLERNVPVGDGKFWATGISLVMHPHNPMAPTVHANFRYFELGDGSTPGSWWFGGGADLTPYYVFDEDARHFHRVYKGICDQHDPTYYPRFKQACDDYFHIPHRGERRGLGGLFFDDLNHADKDTLFPFVRDCAQGFLAAYGPIVQRRHHLPYTDAQKRWQQIRRGRYVEFNLVYDRGTVFGLKTNARIESVLMSLPLTCRWEYCHEPKPDSEEARLIEILQQPREWA